MNAAHGGLVHDVPIGGADLGESVPPGDGLVTKTTGTAVVALAADCVPIVFGDMQAGVVAAVHCGWPGIVARVVENTVAAMERAGASPDRINAVAGPAICGRCYPVPEARYESVIEVAPSAASNARDGSLSLDVRAGVFSQLSACGVNAESVGGCTAEDPNLFSFRRDGVTGRQAGAIALLAGAA